MSVCVVADSDNEGVFGHHVRPCGGVRPVLDARPRDQLPTHLVRHGNTVGLLYHLLEHGSPGVPRNCTQRVPAAGNGDFGDAAHAAAVVVQDISSNSLANSYNALTWDVRYETVD